MQMCEQQPGQASLSDCLLSSPTVFPSVGWLLCHLDPKLSLPRISLQRVSPPPSRHSVLSNILCRLVSVGRKQEMSLIKTIALRRNSWWQQQCDLRETVDKNSKQTVGYESLGHLTSQYLQLWKLYLSQKHTVESLSYRMPAPCLPCAMAGYISLSWWWLQTFTLSHHALSD